MYFPICKYRKFIFFTIRFGIFHTDSTSEAFAWQSLFVRDDLLKTWMCFYVNIEVCVFKRDMLIKKSAGVYDAYVCVYGLRVCLRMYQCACVYVCICIHPCGHVC